jgi:hypothetical protein
MMDRTIDKYRNIRRTPADIGKTYAHLLLVLGQDRLA